MPLSIPLRIAVVILCIAFLVLTIRQIRSQKLLIKYSLLWLLLSIIILVVAVFPEPIFMLANAIGFDAPSNFVFAVGFFFVLALCLSQSRAISQQTLKNTRLTQEVALLKNQQENEDGK